VTLLIFCQPLWPHFQQKANSLHCNPLAYHPECSEGFPQLSSHGTETTAEMLRFAQHDNVEMLAQIRR
jgi:hypothetical protein